MIAPDDCLFVDEFSIPLCMSDIITICKEFNQLGWQIQTQVEHILEIGVEESINTGFVKQQSLPLIKNFLQAICRNPYFGEALEEAQSCIELINAYQNSNFKNLNLSN